MSAAFFTTTAKAREVQHGQSLPPVSITVNDRAATREAIIKEIRSLNVTFVERSEWKALKGKIDMVMDWDYSMIALHHAGRSFGCTHGAEQMQYVQKDHFKKKYDDIGYHYGIDCTGQIFEGRDIRLKGSSVLGFNTGVIGIVLLEDLRQQRKAMILSPRVALPSTALATAPQT
jgi:hypothetical protein